MESHDASGEGGALFTDVDEQNALNAIASDPEGAPGAGACGRGTMLPTVWRHVAGQLHHYRSSLYGLYNGDTGSSTKGSSDFSSSIVPLVQCGVHSLVIWERAHLMDLPQHARNYGSPCNTGSAAVELALGDALAAESSRARALQHRLDLQEVETRRLRGVLESK
jgi:hypothetical protein